MPGGSEKGKTTIICEWRFRRLGYYSHSESIIGKEGYICVAEGVCFFGN